MSEVLKRVLLDVGVPEDEVPSVMERILKALEATGFDEEDAAKLFAVQPILDEFERYKRKAKAITLSMPVYDIIEHFVNTLRDPQGNPYPFSYFLEDAIVWLLKNPELFLEFMADTYKNRTAERVHLRPGRWPGRTGERPVLNGEKTKKN